jgi:hypothetical protein
LNPPAAGSPIQVDRPIREVGFDVWDRKHPIVRFTALGDVQVAKGSRFLPTREDKVVGASDLGPILVAGNRAGRRVVALGFDPRDSDMVLRVAWPLFVLNTINDFIEEDTSYVSSFTTGNVWSIPAPSGPETATLKGPDGKVHTIPVKEGRAVYLGDQAGFYELTVKAEPEPVTSMFAANLSNVEESRITPGETLALGGKSAEAPIGFDPGLRREIWLYLLLAAAIVSTIEWITYHRRLTV